MVREKKIKFDGITINQFYKILIPETDDLSILSSTADMDEVAYTICGKVVNCTMVNGTRT